MNALLDTIATMALPHDAQRVFHGRGGLHPGCEHLALDAYPPVLLLTSFEPLADEALVAIGTALDTRWREIAAAGEPLNWVYQCRQEGGRTETRLMAGAVPEPHVVTEAGTRYVVHLLRGQNHGLFLDMAEGRRWVREHVQPGDKVLNLFAYTCAFSVVALQAGASEVVNVDMSDGALAIGRRNHALNGVAARCEVPAPRHLQLLGEADPRRALRPRHLRPAELPEGQLRRDQGLRAAGEAVARAAGAGRDGAAVLEHAEAGAWNSCGT